MCQRLRPAYIQSGSNASRPISKIPYSLPRKLRIIFTAALKHSCATLETRSKRFNRTRNIRISIPAGLLNAAIFATPVKRTPSRASSETDDGVLPKSNNGNATVTRTSNARPLPHHYRNLRRTSSVVVFIFIRRK